ncbi:antirestriction protein ArdA [Paremcibacter congregatus]|uniref:Antirestriction protein ArdA n=1 Tax=Paremcibacter congregatus TaxID=2043170 RepID=A0A2G4YPU3_9PROT|nr:antirestriction protein ArdA [Paremcibacter congregatus]PHZ84310.1 hypothetical protein CRD36_10845 [Paremcibacter congregatus]QDE28529.1 antirestriction protein ArdA [Paremcibacter congregatus]
MTHNYFAMPYNISVPGFPFTDYDSYAAQAAALKDSFGDPVEEFSIECLDGDNEVLFNALEVTQATLEQWFDDFEGLDGDELIKAIYLAEYVTCDMAEILSQLEDVALFEGDAQTYVEDYIEDCGLLDDMPENLRYYFDTEAFARDMLLGGDITEVDIMGSTYVVWEC